MGLAVNLALQAPDFAAQLLALFGKGLIQIDPSVLGHPHQFGAHGLQQAAVGRASNRIVLQRACPRSRGRTPAVYQLESNSQLIVCASSSSTHSSPKSWRNLIRVAASQGRRSSRYAWPEKNCHVGVSPLHSTKPSSDSLKACLRCSSANMRRSGARRRLPLPGKAARCTCSLKRAGRG